MLNDYNYEMVARLNGTYYLSLQAAVDHVESDKDTVELLKNVEEDITVPEGAVVKINLNNHRVTGHHTNAGTLTFVKGSLVNYGATVIDNTGTLVLGENDGHYYERNVIVRTDLVVGSKKVLKSSATALFI
jgi:hypothetical protein